MTDLGFSKEGATQKGFFSKSFHHFLPMKKQESGKSRNQCIKPQTKDHEMVTQIRGMTI